MSKIIHHLVALNKLIKNLFVHAQLIENVKMTENYLFFVSTNLISYLRVNQEDKKAKSCGENFRLLLLKASDYIQIFYIIKLLKF